MTTGPAFSAAHRRDAVAGSGTALHCSLAFAPRAQREAVAALYALRREVLEIADECREPALARIKLAWWQAELEQTYAGRPQHPLTRALAPAIRAYDLALEYFLELLDGARADVEPRRYADFKELALHCHRVAAAPCQLACSILGYQDHATLHCAHDLGIAFELTRTIHELGADARRGRIYLPCADLQRFGVAEADILARMDGAALRELLVFAAARAEDYYRRAVEQWPAADRLAQAPLLILAAIQRTTLAELRRDGFRVLHGRTTLTPLRQWWIAWRTLRREKARHRRAAGKICRNPSKMRHRSG